MDETQASPDHANLKQNGLTSETFDSQTDLSDFIDRTPSEDLVHVKSITLRLQDIDTAPILAGSATPERNRPSLSQLYDEELDRLKVAFSKLPDVATVTIIPSDSLHSFVYQDFLHRFVRQLRDRTPRIEVVNQAEVR